MYREIIVKSVLNKKKKRDSWFLDEYTLNPYEGCAFNCQYCYIRGSKYGLNMEDGMAVKINTLEILDRQLSLRARKEQFGIIALASATDPYMRIEEQLRLTEGCLMLIYKHRFPVLMITKSPLILRDLALLKDIDQVAIHARDIASSVAHGAIVSFSFSTIDDTIAAKLEPGAPTPDERRNAIRKVKDAGLYVGVNLMPVLPLIHDSTEALEQMISAFKEAGADYVLTGSLTLFGNGLADSYTLYMKFLQRNFPDVLASYARLYNGYFMPSRAYQKDLSARASHLIAKYGLKEKITA